MICKLTQERLAFRDGSRTLIVDSSQREDVAAIVYSIGLRHEWITGATSPRRYTDGAELGKQDVANWILITDSLEDAATLQASLDAIPS